MLGIFSNSCGLAAERLREDHRWTEGQSLVGRQTRRLVFALVRRAVSGTRRRPRRNVLEEGDSGVIRALDVSHSGKDSGLERWEVSRN